MLLLSNLYLFASIRGNDLCLIHMNNCVLNAKTEKKGRADRVFE